MDPAQAQARIDGVEWYHDFDFPNGLRARTRHLADDHRPLWEFIEKELDGIDFRGKSVLDIGCWDGYWSFHAERRGAASVLASDDATQNWAGSRGLLLAKELLGSQVQTRLDLSVYDLASLDRTFDVVLCLGVYYHLHDPFFALAQIRRCCHPGTVLVLEGNVAEALFPHSIHYDLRVPGSKFTPTEGALDNLLQATYFTIERRADLPRQPCGLPAMGWRWRLALAFQALRGSRQRVKAMAGQADNPLSNKRVVWVCRPFTGANDIHHYPPPFGLADFDTRWGRAAA